MRKRKSKQIKVIDTSNADKLKLLRKRLEMTQRELASEFLVSPGAIALWENGDRKIPGPIRRLIEIYEQLLNQKSIEK